MKSSSFARSLELAKLAAKVGIQELRSGDMKSRLNQAMLIANSLSNLKGAAMKAGQLLSLDLDNYFPPEAIEVLSQLQSAATAHPFEEIEKVVNTQISPSAQSRLRGVSRTPIGVASIGQVHRAEFEGREVVLKVQYPGVDDSIESDLKILKVLASSFCQITARKMDLDPLFAEFQSVLEQEVDYQKEARLQKKYREHIQSLNSSGDYHFRVPEVIDALSSKKVLGMGFEKGMSLRSWINSKPEKSQRDKIAKEVLDLYFHEFFEWGFVQTDPNWGNFLIHGENELSLCLLDFGATRSYDREFVRNYIHLLRLTAEGRSQELKKHAIEFGLLDPRESAKAFAVFEKMLGTAISPFFVQKTGQRYFDFADKSHTLESAEATKALSQELVYSPPPYSLVFLHRKLGGVYSILKSLEVKMDISSYWQMMNELGEKGWK